MRSLRSRVIEDSNTSSSTTNNVEEGNNIEEQPEKKRKSKKIKTKKSKKRTSEVNEDEHQGNFVLLRNRKSMTVHKNDENCEDQVNKSTDSQKSINDNIGARKTRNAKRKKRGTKHSINEDDFCPTFESAITSTIMKPKKEIKFFSTSPKNQNLSAKENSPNEKQVKRQKKGRRKQTINENSVDNQNDVLTGTQNEHNFVRAPKHDVTNNTNILIDNTTFDTDKTTETINESAKNKSVSLRERKSDLLIISSRHTTFDKTNDECIKTDKSICETEIPKSSQKIKSFIANETVNDSCVKINNSTFDAANNINQIRPNVFISDMQRNNDDNTECNNSTLKLNKTTELKCSKINNGTFDVDDSILTKSKPNISIEINNKVDQKHSAIDNGTFEIENSFKTHNRKRSSVLINKSSHEVCSKIDDGTFEVEENTKSQKKNKSGHVGFVFGDKDYEEINKSAFKVNKTPYNHRKSKPNLSTFRNQTIQDDDESTDDDTTPTSKNISKKSLFENLSNTKEYVNLDDISDVELDEVINISDDTPVKSSVKQSTFNVSDDESSDTFTKSVRDEENGSIDTFDKPLRNQSGEWQVQDLAKSINAESYVDKTQFGTVTTFAGNNEAMNVDHNFTAKNFTLLNDTNNVLTPNTARKKWQKFARNSHAANCVLEQINSTTNTPRVVKNTTLRQYSSPMPATNELSRKSFARNKSLLASSSKSINKEPKSVNKNTSISKHDISKGVVKRTAMPNFALIHQKAFEKMESLQEYSERKRQRAKLLLSADKKQVNNTSKILQNKENVKKKSSRELFADNTSKEHNRFGFKVKNTSMKKQSPIVKKKMENTTATSYFKSTNIPKPKLIIPKSMKGQDIGMAVKKEKAPIFQRKDVLAIANKNKGENLMKNRENRRDQLKGVRTNRRFELLMKMRNNQ